MHGTLPRALVERVCTTVVTARTFCDRADALEAERLCRVVTAHLRSQPEADQEDMRLAVGRLVRVAQRATVFADDESRTRCLSPIVTGVRWVEHEEGFYTVAFSTNDDRIERGEGSLWLIRDARGWTARL